MPTCLPTTHSLLYLLSYLFHLYLFSLVRPGKLCSAIWIFGSRGKDEVQCLWLLGSSLSAEARTKCGSFYIHLRRNFHESMTVPCFVRRQVNNMVGNGFPVIAPDKEEYVFNLKKQDSKSRIWGPGYKEFISNYDIKAGDRIRLDLETLPQHFGIIQECELGIAKQRVKEAHVFNEDATTVVFRNGMELMAAQTARMNKVVNVRGLGMGAVLVQTLTHTDVKHNGLYLNSCELCVSFHYCQQRIPKAISSALKIAKKGWATCDGRKCESP